jgi:hypothetical protein
MYQLDHGGAQSFVVAAGIGPLYCVQGQRSFKATLTSTEAGALR